MRWLLAIGTPTVAGVLVSGLLDRVLRERLESRERELLLSQQEARTRIVLDSAPDAFVAIDRDGSVRTWNAAAERMLGWSAAEAVGKPLRALIIPPELREANDRLRRDLLDPAEADATRVLELELQRRTGSRFPAEVSCVASDIRGEVFAAASCAMCPITFGARPSARALGASRPPGWRRNEYGHGQRNAGSR